MKWPRVVASAMLISCLVSSGIAFAPVPQKWTMKPARKRLAVRTKDSTETDKISSPESSALNGDSSSPKEEEEYGVWIAPASLREKNALPGAAWIGRLLAEPVVEITEAYLVILSSILVAMATLSLSPSWQITIEDWQNVIAYTFVVEFVARWYASDKGIFRYLSQPLVLVDVVVVILPVVLPFLSGIPPWLTSQSGLINLRLLRILRLQRVLQDLETFSSFAAALGLGDGAKQVKPFQLQLARVILSLFTLLSVSAGLIYAAEHGVNPDMENYFSALYFGLTTLTTVGFGDITPVTSQGKLVVSASILAGVTIIPAQAAALVESLMNAQEERELELNGTDTLPREQRNNSKSLPSSAVDATTPCPSCGATFHWTSAKYCWSCGSKL